MSHVTGYRVDRAWYFLRRFWVSHVTGHRVDRAWYFLRKFG